MRAIVLIFILLVFADYSAKKFSNRDLSVQNNGDCLFPCQPHSKLCYNIPKEEELQHVFVELLEFGTLIAC
ncbi:MAG: hypothetical protein K2N12_04790 [Helicobacter sp.]|nr:hypothetical protein [Helicobacter sp.]